MSVVTVDSKGRITIPLDLREAMGIKPGEKIRIRREGERIVVLPLVTPEEFIKRMEGKVEFKRRLTPEDIKKVWKT